MILQWILQEDYRILTGQDGSLPWQCWIVSYLWMKFIYQRLLLISFCGKMEMEILNDLRLQTVPYLMVYIACYIVVRWFIFIVCLIVYCFCLVLFVNVVGTQFLFLRRLNLLNTFQCKVLNDDISMDSMRKKFIFIHIFPHNCSMKFKKLWFSPSLTGSAE